MSVPQIVKKAATNYVEKFKKDPEAMAASYVCLAAGYCLAYAGLVLAIRELDKREAELADLHMSIALHRSYMDGMLDAYKSFDCGVSCYYDESKNRKHSC